MIVAPVAASGSAPPPTSAPTRQPNAAQDIPVVILLNSESLRPTPTFRDPYYLDFDQITVVIPGGWAGVSAGGVDAATIFHYPSAALSWKHISSTYNPALPTSINLTINSANESGKVFNFQVTVDLDHDNQTDVYIDFPSYTTQFTLRPEYINLVPTNFQFVDDTKTAMDDARIFLKVWRTDTVPENQWAISRLYTGYIYQSMITLPWINPAPTAVMAKPDLSETYWTSVPILFSAAGTLDPSEGLAGLTCKWTYGDNSTPKIGGCDQNATHTYKEPGNYTVTLDVLNSLGFTDSVSRLLRVNYKNIPPTISATVTEGLKVYVGSFSGFAGVPYNFSAVYDDVDNGKEAVNLSWNFDDGTPRTALTNETHTFDSIGDFNVNVAAYDGIDVTTSTIVVTIGQNRPPALNVSVPSRVNKGTTVPFTAVGTIDPDGIGIVSWHWDFGDPFCTLDNPCDSSAPVASHRYDVGGVYTVTFSADDGISQNTTTRFVRVNQQPLAVCPGTKQVETSTAVEFDGSLSQDPDRNDSLSFRWKFGEGHETDFSPSPKASHVYLVPKPEGYSAQLIVSDGLWLHACSLTVRVELLNLPPIAAIWCSAETIWLGDSLRCSANQSQDEFELTYLWDFDDRDGVSFSDDFRRDVSITYQEPAHYRITMQVKDNKGKTAEAAIAVFVKDNLGVCNQIYDMSPFLRQTSASPRTQTRGEFDSDRVSSNLTAVKKGCFSAYSVDMKAGELVTIDIEVKDGLEGKVVDLLAFDVPNFLVYKDKNLPVLPAIISECFKTGVRGSLSCAYTAPRSGTLYIVIDNKDLPVLTATEGPVQYHVSAVMLWPAVSPIPVEWIPVLVIAAIAAVGIAGFIFYLGRRAEKNY